MMSADHAAFEAQCLRLMRFRNCQHKFKLLHLHISCRGGTFRDHRSVTYSYFNRRTMTGHEFGQQHANLGHVGKRLYSAKLRRAGTA